jgi:hypothetical protein
MKYKIIACLLILAVAIGAGCSGQQADTEPEEQVNDTNETEAQEADPEVEDTPTGEPELEIMAVNLIDNNFEMTIKNKGNATTEDVYAGVVAYDVRPNFATYNSYQTTENWPYALFDFITQALQTGQTFTYDTGYKPESTDPNIQTSRLSLTGGLISQQYKPTIEPGETVTFTMSNVWGYDEYMKVAWMDGQEDEFVLW